VTFFHPTAPCRPSSCSGRRAVPLRCYRATYSPRYSGRFSASVRRRPRQTLCFGPGA
jgi:hypothetical protein